MKRPVAYTHLDLERWCRVLQGMLLWDLAHFELARMVNDLPLGLEEKRRILPEAVKLSRACPQNAGADAILRELMGFYAEEKHLNLEGFMRFRMQDVLRAVSYTHLVGRAAPLTGSSGRVMPHVLYHLGRWVYLIDAWDDRHKDREKGAYNPFLAAGASREQAAFLLHLSLNEATDAYELLGIDLHKGLLDNIIYVGCPGNTRRILEDKDEQSL